ncbi:MAG TPA: hypothetical protein VHN36_07105 [Ilumatobacteraceae bacterium]|nr:hypothetical protein [Ilumatobacteraceae bacterium]
MITRDPESPPSSRLTVREKARGHGLQIASGIGFVVAGGLLAYGMAQANEPHPPGSDTPPAIAVVEAPSPVQTTHPVAQGSVPDVNLISTDTVDIALPPVPPPTTVAP